MHIINANMCVLTIITACTLHDLPHRYRLPDYVGLVHLYIHYCDVDILITVIYNNFSYVVLVFVIVFLSSSSHFMTN